MSDPTITLTDEADPAIRDAIGAALKRYNEEQVGPINNRPLSIVLRAADSNEIIGGLTGRTSLGLLFIDLFVVPKDSRGSGLGRRLLRMAEEEGKKRGCRAATLYTMNFQAPDFYEKYGYRRFGAKPDYYEDGAPAWRYEKPLQGDRAG